MSLRSRTLRAKLLRLSRRTARLVLGHGRMAAGQRVEMASRFRALIWRRAARAAGKPAAVARSKLSPTVVFNSDVRMSWAFNLWLRWTKNERIPAPSGNVPRPKQDRRLPEGSALRLRTATSHSRAGALSSHAAAAFLSNGTAEHVQAAPRAVIIDRQFEAPMRLRMMRIASSARDSARGSIGDGRHSALKFSNAGASRRDIAASIQGPGVPMAGRRAVASTLRPLAAAGAEAPGGVTPLRRSLSPRAAAASRHEARTLGDDLVTTLARHPLALRYAAPARVREGSAVSPPATASPAVETASEVRASRAAAQRSAAGFTLDSAATERLTEEIIRRVDRRIRIERERCGR